MAKSAQMLSRQAEKNRLRPLGRNKLRAGLYRSLGLAKLQIFISKITIFSRNFKFSDTEVQRAEESKNLKNFLLKN